MESFDNVDPEANIKLQMSEQRKECLWSSVQNADQLHGPARLWEVINSLNFSNNILDPHALATTYCAYVFGRWESIGYADLKMEIRSIISSYWLSE